MPADITSDQTDELTGGPGPGADGSTRVVDSGAARAALASVAHEPGATKPDPIVVADNVVRQFGGLTAVDVDHVEIQRGVITALIGPNGAGKTTFFNLLTGFDKPQSGTWSFNGQLAGRRARLQGGPHGHDPHLPADQGALQAVGDREHASRRHRPERREVPLAASSTCGAARRRRSPDGPTALLERFLLIKKREDFAGTLSGGQRKLLEMARALMADPELVMLDEPMAGVNPALKQSLLGHVKSLRDEGRTVLFVEHDMDMVRDISDWVIVMAQGKVIAEGPPDSVMSDQRVIDAYLGSHHDQDLSVEMEEKILAEAQEEIARTPGRHDHREGRSP